MPISTNYGTSLQCRSVVTLEFSVSWCRDTVGDDTTEHSSHWSIWFLNFFAERRFFKVHTIMNVGNLMLLHDSISHLDVNYMIFESSKWRLLLSMLYDWLDEPVHLIIHPSPLIKSSVPDSFLESCSMTK